MPELDPPPPPPELPLELVDVDVEVDPDVPDVPEVSPELVEVEDLGLTYPPGSIPPIDLSIDV